MSKYVLSHYELFIKALTTQRYLKVLLKVNVQDM